VSADVERKQGATGNESEEERKGRDRGGMENVQVRSGPLVPSCTMTARRMIPQTKELYCHISVSLRLETMESKIRANLHDPEERCEKHADLLV
jgi:hypothetical protein